MVTASNVYVRLKNSPIGQMAGLTLFVIGMLAFSFPALVITSNFYPPADMMVLASLLTFSIALYGARSEGEEEDAEEPHEEDLEEEEYGFIDAFKAIALIMIMMFPFVSLPTLAGGLLGGVITVELGYPAWGLIAAFGFPLIDFFVLGALGISITGVGIRWIEFIQHLDEKETETGSSESSPSLGITTIILSKAHISFTDIGFPRGKLAKIDF